MVDTYTVIEGTVKFRDGKKWKSRWCVMRKLSPVADCLHLQLYRDSKDRYKQGQTKASLSLQHFLGVQSGFTLDKESNTIAIICQDVTVVLAFDTRERLIQWQVKIANNLGEDDQFLVQISSAPMRAKLSPGPALLHILEYQFCLTVGVPPRLVGCWQISQLRRYGVVESRFCFEGGSRCGRGEGLYVLVTDQGDEITRTFRLAAEGKLSSKKRPASRNASDSPKKSNHGRAETRMSDVSCLDTLLQTQQISAPQDDGCCECSRGHEEILNWQLAGDFGDASSVADFMDSNTKESNLWIGETAIERCASCISKLGALSRSSTAAMTPNSSFTPAWTMEANSSGTKTDASRVSDANVLSVGLNQTSMTSECSTGLGSDYRSVKENQSAPGNERCQCCPPVRPPKPGHLSSHSPKSSPKKRQNVPLDTSCTCNITVNPYDNYDVPKAPPSHSCSKDVNCHWNPLASEQEYYDTPKNIMDNIAHEYQNYDTPQPVLIERKQMCTTLQKNQYLARVVIDNEDMHMVACPCQRIMCWAENWMFLPYCRRGNGRENTAPPLHKKVTECGGEVIINNLSSVYATVDKSKKIKNRLPSDQERKYDTSESQSLNVGTYYQSDKDSSLHSSGYENSTTPGKEQKSNIILKSDANATEIGQNYSNFDFLQSLEFYENSKDMMQKSVKSQVEIFDKNDAKHLGTHKTHASENPGFKMCLKCRHECKLPPVQPCKQDDYLMMEPSASDSSIKSSDPQPVSLCGKHVPGYLPMHPIGGQSCLNHQELLKLRMCQQMMHASGRAASSPSLIEHINERCRNRADTEPHRTTGSSLLGFNHSVSAANSPYLRRRVLGCLHESTESDISSQISRKRSCSSDSTNNLRDMDFIMNKSSTSSHNSQNEVELIKNSSTDTICSHRSSNKKSVDFDMTPVTYIDDESRRIGDDDTHISESNDLPTNEGKSQYKNIDWAKIDFNEPVVHIRRSSSVPSKSSHNRDSSSSNDSGVSTSSLKKRKADFVDGGIQDCSSGPSRRYTYTRGDKDFLCECFHLSLPRRSKSVDPLRDLAFQFQKVEVPMKSSSAEAEVPICHPKRESRGCLSPGAAVPYIDSRSTSSGTSDMSDYFETLSLSSFSSSDTPDSLHFGHQAVSTMRPRSGKEYQKIDRNILETDLKRAQPSKSAKESTSSTEKEG